MALVVTAPRVSEELSCARQIEAFAQRKIEAFLGTVDIDGTYKDRIYKSARSAALQIAGDYGRRFLLELIQNAHDAHPAGETNGEIKVVFDPAEDDAGVLYVANHGTGFTWSNVDALCSIGLSDKPVGESIGNKGLGFRSVVFVADNPEIYSCLGSGRKGAEFDGYSFRFAGDEDLQRWIADPVLRRLASQDLPPFHVPVPLTEVPEHARQLADQGFCTVVRLPLRNDTARQAVRDEIAAVRDQSVPLLLFLTRVSLLDVSVEGEPQASYQLSQSRSPLDLEELAGQGDSIAVVETGDSARYLVASSLVPEARVQEAIAESIKQTRLSASWADWRGDGEVAVAVRLDGPVTPRIYTFLPLGDQAQPPFHGYLHAAFFPKVDRTTLEPDVPLNKLYVWEAAALCARTSVLLRQAAEAGSIDPVQAGRAILDLVCWRGTLAISGEHARRAATLVGDSFDALGRPISGVEGALVQPLPAGARWVTFGSARNWDHPELSALGTAALVSMAEVPVLAPELESDRVKRLDVFLKELNRGLHLDLTQTELVGAIERVAVAYWEQKAAASTWKRFYRELRDLATKQSLDLRGRRLLLCGDGDLRLTQISAPEPEFPLEPLAPDVSPSTAGAKRRRRRVPVDVAVFVPSERAVGEAARAGSSVIVPPELERAFVYLRDDLDWYGELNQVRTHLEGAKLVRSYNADELLTQVSALVRVDDRIGVRRAALAWAFRLFQESRASRPVSLRRARLYVPTAANTWIDARLAHFGAGWPAETHGDTLERFLAASAAHSESLQRLRSRLISRPVSKPFSMRQLHEWTAFLTAIGVRRGLQPERREPRNLRVWAWEFSAPKLAVRLGLAEEGTRVWAAAIAESGASPSYTNSQYEHEGGLWALPGQDVHAALSPAARTLYAALVLAWLESADESALSVQFFFRAFHKASRFSWPTPLAAFLRYGEWLPSQAVGGAQMELRFHRPAAVWLGSDGPYSLPQFLPGFPRALATLLARRPIVDRLASWCGANVFNALPSLGRQVGYMAQLYAEDRVDPYHLRAFLNEYYECWRRLAREQPALDWAAVGRPKYLIARRSGSYEFVSTAPQDAGPGDNSESPPLVYVRDVESPLQLALVEATGAYVFDAGSLVPDGLRPLVERALGPRCRPISGVEVSLVLDGVDFDPERSDDDYVVAACPWLPVLVALAMESLIGPAAHRLPADRRVILERLQRIRLRLAQTIQFRAQGEIVAAPDELQGAMALAAGSRPTVVLRSDTGGLDWRSLTHGVRAICELLRNADLAPHLQIGMSTLSQFGEQVSGPMPADKRMSELCESLHVRSTEAESALVALGTDVRRIVRLLIPVVHYVMGQPGLDRFMAAESEVHNVVEATALLHEVLGETHTPIDVIVEAARGATTFAEIRDALQLDFGKFNESLAAVGEQPDVHPDVHADVLRAFVADRRNDILDSLRALYVEIFERRDSLLAYVQARADLDGLGPDPDWLVGWREPNEALLQARVSGWLTTRGARPLGIGRTDLPPWSQARRENAAFVRKVVGAYASRVRAWCRRPERTMPVPWHVPSSAPDVISAILDAVGALDFAILDEPALLDWMVTAEVWPSGMPPTRSLDLLGLNEEDLNDERDRQRREQLDRDRVARSIEFNGRSVDPQEADHTELSDEIATKLTRAVKSLNLTSIAPVQKPPERPGGSSGGGTSSSGGPKKLHPDKTDLIGFLGECAVYHWLKARFPRQDIDSAWVSKNRSRLLLGEGQDNLGYDFKIRFRQQTWFLEVKAHLDDPLLFEMGETELKAAHDAARRRTGEYRVIYVSRLRDTAAMHVEILPNPLSPDGEVRFTKGEQGVRYTFRRA